MSISFSCENCGKDFQTDASLAGKKCKCKQCGHVFLIPSQRSSGSSRPLQSFGDPGPARPATVPPRPPSPKSSPRPSRPNYLDEDDDPYRVDDFEPLPARKPVGPSAADDDDFQGPRPLPMKPRKRKRSSSTSADFFGGLPAIYFIVVAAIVGVGFLASLIGLRPVGMVTMVVGILAALVPMVYGGIGMLVVPFMESAVHGICCFFFWPYQLYYLVSRWDAMRGSFLTYLGGLGLMVGAVLPMIGIARDAASEAQARAQAQLQARADSMPQVPGYPPDMPGFLPGPPVMPPAVPSVPPPPFGAQPGGNIMPRPPLFTPPRPALPNDKDSVVLEVTGLTDKDTEQAFADKLENLLQREFNNLHSFGFGGGGRKTYRISTSVDPKVLADKITWAKVTSIDGRTIHVEMSPVPASERRPDETDFVASVLFDLKAPAQNRRRDALRRLTNAPPDKARQLEVAKAIEPMLKDPDGFTRAEAVKALSIWGGKENTPALIEALRDPAFNVVWAVLDALAVMKDPAAAEPVAQMLTIQRDRGKATEVLRAIGSEAEPVVVKYLNHGDMWVRAEAAKILQVIGTETCVPALQQLIRNTNGHGLDAMAAGEALDNLGAPRFGSPVRKKGGLVPKTKSRR